MTGWSADPRSDGYTG